MKLRKALHLPALLLVLLLLLSFTACSESYVSEDMEQNFAGTTAPSEDGNLSVLPSDETSAGKNQKIIKEVNESVETEQYDAFIDHLRTEVEQSGGYISSVNYTGKQDSRDERTARYVIRIPAEHLSTFTDAISSLATVTSYNENQTDVTLAYVDIESRIEVLSAEQTALLQLLEKANSTTEMLSIRKQLEEVQENLASYKAQKKVYDDKIAFSTVHLSVYEVEKETPEEKNFFTKATQTFLESVRNMGNILYALALFFVGAIPYLALPALVLLVVLLVTRLSKRKK